MIRLGSHPPTEMLYRTTAAQTETPWRGRSLTAEEHERVSQRLTEVVEDLGGMVSNVLSFELVAYIDRLTRLQLYRLEPNPPDRTY